MCGGKMLSRSFRIFAIKIHYFKCGRIYDLIETANITNGAFLGISTKGNHTNNRWLVCHKDVIPLKRKNNMCQDNSIFFLDQELNESSVVINIGGIYEDKALFPTEISTIWYENIESKELYTMLKKSCEKYVACTKNGYLIGKDAYLYKNQYRFCTIGIDSPQIYDLKFE